MCGNCDGVDQVDCHDGGEGVASCVTPPSQLDATYFSLSLSRLTGFELRRIRHSRGHDRRLARRYPHALAAPVRPGATPLHLSAHSLLPRSFLGGGWVHLFGYGSTHSDMNQIRRIRAAADFLGGDNMFQRYVFGDGKWLLTMGYSVSYYEKPLTREDMAAMVRPPRRSGCARANVLTERNFRAWIRRSTPGTTATASASTTDLSCPNATVLVPLSRPSTSCASRSRLRDALVLTLTLAGIDRGHLAQVRPFHLHPGRQLGRAP